jgi:hypothetical protein
MLAEMREKSILVRSLKAAVNAIVTTASHSQKGY